VLFNLTTALRVKAHGATLLMVFHHQITLSFTFNWLEEINSLAGSS
jgi:hypothetical protein